MTSPISPEPRCQLLSRPYVIHVHTDRTVQRCGGVIRRSAVVDNTSKMDDKLADAQDLATIYGAPGLLSNERPSKGISNVGDTRRLERTLWKPVTGMS